MLQNCPIPNKDSLQTRRRIQFCFIDDSDVQDYDDRKADLEEDRDADRETEGDSRSRKSWRSTHIKHRSELYRNNLRKGRYQRRKTYLLADVV